jgi:hypothetical protein
MYQKRIYIVGGGTFSYIRTHLGLSAMSFGNTARQIENLCQDTNMEAVLVLTAMGNSGQSFIPPAISREFDAYGVVPKSLVTNDDVARFLHFVNQDMKAKIVFMSAAMCDFTANILDVFDHMFVSDSGKYRPRLDSNRSYRLDLNPAQKVISLIRNGGIYTTVDNQELKFQPRKDIFLVGFKTTSGDTEDTQYLKALNLCKKASCNLVLANDVVTRRNMIVTPEEARYHVTTNRNEVLKNLVEMANLRSHLTFTRSTVVAGESVPWDSPLVPNALRTVVDHCIKQAAYKPFNDLTVGHFACKLDDTTFLTSRRKTNFNFLSSIGLVKIKTDGPDSVIAYGGKPSVGGQSQRIVFTDHPEYDCIVHFHCPIRPDSKVPIVSQREFECGSHECGRNTSNNLKQFSFGLTPTSTGAKQQVLSAVYLDQHGPNIVFNRTLDPFLVIKFIEENFDLSQKTGGPVS